MSQGLPVLPVLFTSANLLCGLLASLLAINDALRLVQYEDVFKPFELSAWLIIAAIVLDALDGLVARHTKTESRFGVEYDSLADVISFGMAPALLVYLSVLREYGRFGWIFVSLYVMCGAIRLARFNATKTAALNPKSFEGLPIPAAAGTLASYVLLSMWGEWHLESKGVFFDRAMGWYLQHVSYYNQVVLPIAVLLLSLLMVSTLEYPRIKRLVLNERMSFLTFVCISILMLCVLLTPPPVTVCVISVVYLSVGITNGFYVKSRHGVGHASHAEHVRTGAVSH